MPNAPFFSRRVATAAFICLMMTGLFLLIGYAANFFFLVFGGVAFAVYKATGKMVGKYVVISTRLVMVTSPRNWVV